MQVDDPQSHEHSRAPYAETGGRANHLRTSLAIEGIALEDTRVELRVPGIYREPVTVSKNPDGSLRVSAPKSINLPVGRTVQLSVQLSGILHAIPVQTRITARGADDQGRTFDVRTCMPRSKGASLKGLRYFGSNRRGSIRVTPHIKNPITASITLANECRGTLALVQDISYEGLSIRVNNRPHMVPVIGDEIKVHLHLDTEEEPLVATCTLRRCRQFGKYLRLGLEFSPEDLEENSRLGRAVQSYVIQRQRDLLQSMRDGVPKKDSAA